MTGFDPSDLAPDRKRPPERVLAAARAAYRMRRPDAVLADLLTDSTTDPTPGLRRGFGGGPRLLAFSAADLELHLQVTVHGDACDIAGQLIPPAQFTVEIRFAEGRSQHTSDPYGAFVLRAIPLGPFSLVCSQPLPDAPVLATPWTML